MNIQAQQLSAYAPVKPNSVTLASITIQAVDRIGSDTSKEIEETADQIMRGANEIAEKLRELACAIREHSRIANEHVIAFCDKATSVLEGVRGLQHKLEVNEREPENAATESEMLPLPKLIKRDPQIQIRSNDELTETI